MKVKSILKGAALFMAALFVMLALILWRPLLYHWKSEQRMYAAAQNSNTEYRLQHNGCHASSKFLMRGPATNFAWQEIENVRLTKFMNCIARPVRIFMSPDETTLFVRRRADRESSQGLHPSAPLAFWSDVVDVSQNPPRLVYGGGTCCMEENYAPQRELNLIIDSLAQAKGITITPY